MVYSDGTVRISKWQKVSSKLRQVGNRTVRNNITSGFSKMDINMHTYTNCKLNDKAKMSDPTQHVWQPQAAPESINTPLNMLLRCFQSLPHGHLVLLHCVSKKVHP